MKEIIDTIHKTMYQFFDVCGEDEECNISDKDELLLEVNKAICANLKALEQKEPFINKPCVAWGVCREDKMKVLNKIVEELADMEKEFESRHDYPRADTLKCSISIINKYMAESEIKNED